jgi:hypothetical protein
MVLFTFYMITDPQTTPSRLRSQIFFGAGIAAAYSVLLLSHVQYTMFYSVTAICALRGAWLLVLSRREVSPALVPEALSPAAAKVGGSAHAAPGAARSAAGSGDLALR